MKLQSICKGSQLYENRKPPSNKLSIKKTIIQSHGWGINSLGTQTHHIINIKTPLTCYIEYVQHSLLKYLKELINDGQTIQQNKLTTK